MSRWLVVDQFFGNSVQHGFDSGIDDSMPCFDSAATSHRMGVWNESRIGTCRQRLNDLRCPITPGRQVIGMKIDRQLRLSSGKSQCIGDHLGGKLRSCGQLTLQKLFGDGDTESDGNLFPSDKPLIAFRLK